MPIWTPKRGAALERRGGLRKIRGYRRAWLVYKRVQQRLMFPEQGRGRATFVVGAQRSGTSIFTYALDRSLHTWTFLEQAPEIQDHWRMRPHEAIREVIREQRAPCIVMKPLWDTHRTDQLLTSFEDSRAIWLYRWYPDVVRSAVKLFGPWQRELMTSIARGDREEAGWVMERLGDEDIELVRELDAEGLNDQAGAALFWYLRNKFYFSLALDEDARVLLLRYRDLVTQPEPVFRRVCEFLEIPCEDRLFEDIEAGSDRRTPPPENVPTRLLELCDELGSQLGEVSTRHLESGLGRGPGHS